MNTNSLTQNPCTFLLIMHFSHLPDYLFLNYYFLKIASSPQLFRNICEFGTKKYFTDHIWWRTPLEISKQCATQSNYQPDDQSLTSTTMRLTSGLWQYIECLSPQATVFSNRSYYNEVLHWNRVSDSESVNTTNQT